MRLHAERGESARIFAANHPAADDDKLLRHLLEFQDFVGVVDAIVVEGKLLRTEWQGACGDEYLFAGQERMRAIRADSANSVRIEETRHAAKPRYLPQIEPGV